MIKTKMLRECVVLLLSIIAFDIPEHSTCYNVISLYLSIQFSWRVFVSIDAKVFECLNWPLDNSCVLT